MHQDERLFFIYAHMLVAPAFPSRLLDEPSRRYFNFAIGFGITWDVGIILLQSLKLRLFNDGIFEKTACVADLLHIGQLGIADGADGVVELE